MTEEFNPRADPGPGKSRRAARTRLLAPMADRGALLPSLPDPRQSRADRLSVPRLAPPSPGAVQIAHADPQRRAPRRPGTVRRRVVIGGYSACPRRQPAGVVA